MDLTVGKRHNLTKTYNPVILSKRSASKDLRTEYLLGRFTGAKIPRLTVFARDDRVVRWTGLPAFCWLPVYIKADTFRCLLRLFRKLRRIFRASEKQMGNHFAPGRVPGAKYISGCKCGICLL